MKGPCPDCGSSDAREGPYPDGHYFCFSCQMYTAADGALVEEVKLTQYVQTATTQALSSRGITEATCRHWGYQVGEDYNGNPVQIANYRDAKGQLVCQKLRTRDKKFPTIGDAKDKPLYGMWLWGEGGKYLTITEGEIDALSVSQVMNNRWPVISLPDGASSAGRALGKHLDWVNSFDTIVLCFDQDAAGREAVEEAIKVIPIGKVKVMNLPEKDANETLLKHGAAKLLECFWNAKSYRPDGIIAGSEVSLERLKTVVKGFPMPYPGLETMTMGLRKREITMLTAGTGIGKSTLARELGYHLHQRYGVTIGNVFLEESVEKTVQGYVAMHNNMPIWEIRYDPSRLTDDQWKDSLNTVIKDRMYFYDHFGSLDSDTLLTKLRYLATVVRCDFIILDHISIVVSGMESSQGERKDIDVLMSSLRSLVENTGVGIIAIVHLNQPDGQPHEEGGRVTLRHLRGSGSLKQLSDNVIALERDQQGKNPTHTQVRLLKCRETGEAGQADMLNYNKVTGRYEVLSGFEK